MGEKITGGEAVKLLWEVAKLAAKVFIKEGKVTESSMKKEALKMFEESKKKK